MLSNRAALAFGLPRSIMHIVSAAPPPLYFIHATLVAGVIAMAAFGRSGLMIAFAAIACQRRLFNLFVVLINEHACV